MKTKLLTSATCLCMLLISVDVIAQIRNIPNNRVDLLISAIEEANSNGISDTLRLFPGGIYVLNSRYEEAGHIDPLRNEKVASALPPIIDDTNLGPDLVVLGNDAQFIGSVGNQGSGFRAIYMDENASLVIRGANFQSFSLTSYPSEASGIERNGAVIAGKEFEKLEMINCVFEDNQQTSNDLNKYSGGGVFGSISGDSIIVRNCTFKRNRAHIGGAMYIGNEGNPSYVLIESSVFENNGNFAQLGQDGGGAVRMDGNGAADWNIRNSSFFDNFTYSDGAAIRAVRIFDLRIENCVFAQNRTMHTVFNHDEEVRGGAVSLKLKDNNTTEGERLEIVSCSFYHNYAKEKGGALYLDIREGSAAIKNTLIAFNKVGQKGTEGIGGGIYAFGSNDLEIYNSTIAYNEAGLYGGEIRGLNQDDTYLQNTILAHNIAQNSLGIRQNSLGPDENVSGDEKNPYFTDRGNNLEFPAITDFRDNAYAVDGGSLITEDPLLSDTLNFLCGNIAVLSIASFSPARDVGQDISEVRDQDLLFDLRGEMREGKVDIGAYEVLEDDIPWVKITVERTRILGLAEDLNKPVVFQVSELDPGSQQDPDKKFQWYKNNSPIGINSPKLEILNIEESDQVFVVMKRSQSPACELPSSATSNRMKVVYDIAPGVILNDIGHSGLAIDGQEEVNISASVNQNQVTLTDDIRLQYRGIRTENREDTWSSFDNFSVGGSGTISIEVPKEWFVGDELGLEYRFMNTNVSGISDTSEIHYIYKKYPEGIDFTSSLSFGRMAENYRTISVPLELETKSIKETFNGQLEDYKSISWLRNWRMFQVSGTGDEGMFIEFDEENGPVDFEVGRSYFIAVKDKKHLRKNNRLLSGPGEVVNNNRTNLFSLSLEEGWNQIASPYPFDVDWQDVLDENPGVQTKLFSFGGFSGAYVQEMILRMNSGNFVYATEALTLEIPLLNKINRTARPEIYNGLDQDHWEVNFVLNNEEQKNGLGGLGMSPQAKKGLDYLDFLTPPRMGDLLEINFTNDEYDQYSLSKDMVPPAKQYMWEFDVVSSRHGELHTLTWENKYFGKSGLQLWLFDKKSQKVVDMSKYKQHSFFASQAKTSFQIYYGSHPVLRELLKPSQIFLGLPQPHPIREHAKIPFTLIEELGVVEVELKLYDLVGKDILNLFQGRLEGGFHEVNWDLANSNLPSGTYLMHLRINKQPVAVQKVQLR